MILVGVRPTALPLRRTAALVGFEVIMTVSVCVDTEDEVQPEMAAQRIRRETGRRMDERGKGFKFRPNCSETQLLNSSVTKG